MSDYPGKHYKWSQPVVDRMTQLIEHGASYIKTAFILNAEFPQVIELTDDAVIGKMYRVRRQAA